jgi:hypothetical protein
MDFLLLQLDLLLLLNDVDLDLLGLNQLAGLVFLQVIGEVGLGFALVHRRPGTAPRSSGIIALGLGNLAVGGELGFLAGLLSLGGANLRVTIGLGLRDDGVAFDLGDAGLAQRIEVALVVADVANGEAHDAQAHVGHVAGGDLLHFGGEGIPVLVDVLDSHRAQDRAQVTLQGLGRDVLDFITPLLRNCSAAVEMEISSSLSP